jgi:thiamine pyrophosphate-dependent acetolactate synthase large subunit-like protein
MDFAAIAEGFGVAARRITNSRDVGPAFREALRMGKPVLVEIPVMD